MSPKEIENRTIGNVKRNHALILIYPGNRRLHVSRKFETFSSVLRLWIGAVQDCFVLHTPSINGSFHIFKSSQFLDIVNKSDEIDEELDGDEHLDRMIIRAEAFRTDDSAGHDAETLRFSSGNKHSSGDDLGQNRYGSNDNFYQQYKATVHQNSKETLRFFMMLVMFKMYLT